MSLRQIKTAKVIQTKQQEVERLASKRNKQAAAAATLATAAAIKQRTAIEERMRIGEGNGATFCSPSREASRRVLKLLKIETRLEASQDRDAS